LKKYSSIDALRAICAFFIVFIHIPVQGIIGDVFMPITRIAVPFFFMVSGFFLWNDNHKLLQSKILKQIKKIFALVVLSNLLFFLWDIIINHKDIMTYLRNISHFRTMAEFLFLNESPFGIHLWFLGALLYVLIIYYLLDRYNLNNKIKFLIPILLLTDLIFGKYSILIFNREFNYLFVRNFLFVGIPCFYLGNIIREKIETNKQFKFNNNILLSGCVIFSITSILEKYLLVINNVNATRDQYISTTLLVICVFMYLVQNPMIFKDKIIEQIGNKYSLDIYIVHPIFIYLVNAIVKHLGNSVSTVYSFIAPIIIYFITLIFVMTYKYFMKTMKDTRRNIITTNIQ